MADSMEDEVPSAGGVGHEEDTRSLRAVGDDIRRVQHQISRLDEAVNKLDDTIESMWNQVRETADPEERKRLEKQLDYFRQETHDLRQEKHDLLQKEHDLRQEKQVLLQKEQALRYTGQRTPGTPAQQLFWRKLPKAELTSKEVSINQDEDMEVLVNQVTANVLELQENTTFMGVEEGMPRIMVPQFYEGLWEIADKLINEKTGLKRMVVTGTSGTGKSVMGWYFVYQLRKKLGPFNLVYQHERTQKQTLFAKDGSVTSAATTSNSFDNELTSRDTVFVVDGAHGTVRNAMTFIFISPNPKGFKEIFKEPWTQLYYSSIWSKTDILAAHQLLYKDIDESLVLELYGKWGGVPRHVLEKAENPGWQNHLNTTVQSVSLDDCLDIVTKVGGEGRTDNITDAIVHIRTEDYVHRTVVFASRYASELAYAALEKGAWLQTVQFLNRKDSITAGFRGQLFELAAHKVLMQKCRVRIRSLEKTGQSETETLDWPELQPQTFTDVQDVKEGPVGCYWSPVSKTNPSFDAVCTNIGATLGTSAALQMTISKEHDIKRYGLVKLLNEVPSVKRFYFVVPPSIFMDFKKQALVTKDSQPPKKKLKLGFEALEQWALELQLDYSPKSHAEA